MEPYGINGWISDDVIVNMICTQYTLFFIRTSNFRVRLGCSYFFGNFSLKLFFKNCSYFMIFLNSELVVSGRIHVKWHYEICVCYCFIQRKNLKLSRNSVRDRDELAYHFSSAR